MRRRINTHSLCAKPFFLSFFSLLDEKKNTTTTSTTITSNTTLLGSIAETTTTTTTTKAMNTKTNGFSINRDDDDFDDDANEDDEGEKRRTTTTTPTKPPMILEGTGRTTEDATTRGPPRSPPRSPPLKVVATSAEGREKKEFHVKSRVSAKASFDGNVHPATVVEIQRGRRTQKNDQQQEEEEEEGEIEKYYIHYEKFDKRLDEWVSAENVHEYIGDGLFDEREAQNGGGGGGAGNVTGASGLGINTTNNESTPHSATNQLSLSNKNSTGEGTRKLTRTMKRRYNEIHNVDGVSVEDLPRIEQLAEKEHEEKTKMKNIRCVQFGKYEMDAWYYSPYPEITGQCDMLYVCPFCMKYMRKPKTMQKHKKECAFTHPPGRKIYEHEKANDEQTTICFWEVDGKKAKTYCQNLCLVAKLFLDHKTLYYDVEPFNFYIMTECENSSSSNSNNNNNNNNRNSKEKGEEEDDRVHVPVGYFSKEKHSAEEYNLACILTLPSHQRRGYGSFLIAMSYELSKRECKFGTPERPLSDLGRVSYRSYWSKHILEAMRGHKNMNGLTIRELSAKTMFRESDVTSALQSLNMLKYWKGQHIISATPKIVETHLQSFSKTTTTNRSNLRFEPSFVNWQPPAASEPLNPKKK